MAEDYIMPYACSETLYFLNTEDIKPQNLKKEQTLVIYGKIIEFNMIDNSNMEIAVRYYERE